jgi:hypothetical protein
MTREEGTMTGVSRRSLRQEAMMQLIAANDPAARLIRFRERHWVPFWTLICLHLTIVSLVTLVELVVLIKAVPVEGFAGPTATKVMLFANGMGLFLVVLVLQNHLRRVISIDSALLHIGWRPIPLRTIVGWERVEGRSVRQWRRKLLKPMGSSMTSIGMWAASGGVSSMFCPPWMRTALVIELSGPGGPNYVLVGTRRPEEFESALAAALEDLRRRGQR